MYSGIDSSSIPMNSVIRFWAATNTAIPSTLNRSSAWYSPWPDMRGAAARHDISTAAMPATANSMMSSSERSSIRSAPEMIDAGWWKRQIAAAIDSANVSSVSPGTIFSRITAGRNRPTSSTTKPPTARTSSGENAFQSMCGPLMWAAASSSVIGSPP